jgi:glycosyltransferase involved in cell wall biosynthesis
MKVSVVITTSGRKTLGEAVQSVQEQTFKDWELIIVNDCPAKPLREPGDGIRIINNQKRLGGCKSLNVGLRAAQGEYIAILDDDDEWLSRDKLEKQVKFLDENPDYIACGTNPQIGQGDEIKINLTGTPFAHVSIMFRKGTMYDERLERAKDLDLMIRLSQKGKLGLIKDCFVGFAISDDLDKKIADCYWHKKVILLHKEFPDWFGEYLKQWQRELKLRRYKLINALRRSFGRKGG